MTDLLDTLRFVRGGVAKKDFTGQLTHVRIKDGFITSFNGKIAMRAPINFDMNICPEAADFEKAILACRDTVQMSMSPSGRLSVRSGPFRKLINCIDLDTYPDVQPEGEPLTVDHTFLRALREVSAFIAEDASRGWARAVLLRNKSAYATNNIVVVQRWIGHAFPAEVSIPKEAVDQLLRIKEEPRKIQLSEHSITFFFSGDRWMRTSLAASDWPDVERLFDVQEANCLPVNDQLFAGLEALLPFVDKMGRVYFKGGVMSTTANPSEDGALFYCDYLEKGIFNAKQILMLRGLIDKIDFSMWPKPCIFYGGQVRGAIVGYSS